MAPAVRFTQVYTDDEGSVANRRFIEWCLRPEPRRRDSNKSRLLVEMRRPKQAISRKEKEDETIRKTGKDRQPVCTHSQIHMD